MALVLLPVFTATRLEQVPAGMRSYLSVDGTVPGACRAYDHHVTGEPINLDAMPADVDTASIDAVCTTQADADAMASMVAVMFGGASRVPAAALCVLKSASWWCDHLVGHPALDDNANRLGLGLRGALAHALGDLHTPETGAPLQAFVHAAALAAAAGQALPFAPEDTHELDVARKLDGEGRLLRVGRVAILDTRGVDRPRPEAVYRLHGCPVGLTFGQHRGGGLKYTVGVNPFVRPVVQDLRPALRAVAAAEFLLGPPVLGPLPEPGQENWGGRAAVFGSPWNHGSRLEPLMVAKLVEENLEQA
jgi:hypothetical protein